MKTMTHKFVDSVPDDLEEGVLYISMEYGTVLHKCCCGCGSEVNTPLSPASWSLKYDGERISLSPSIGNWSFPCQSHYWIKKSKVIWSERWNEFEIEEVRKQDRDEIDGHYKGNSKKRKFSKKWRKKLLSWFG